MLVWAHEDDITILVMRRGGALPRLRNLAGAWGGTLGSLSSELHLEQGIRAFAEERTTGSPPSPFSKENSRKPKQEPCLYFKTVGAP